MNRAKRLSIWILLICLIIAGGSTVVWVSGFYRERVVLYSLNPALPPNQSGKDAFNGWEILGSVDFNDTEDIEKINSALKLSIENGDDQYMCFEPRHGVLIQRGFSRTEYVICVHCTNLRMYRNGKNSSGFVSIDPKPLKIFDDYLGDAGIPIAQ